MPEEPNNSTDANSASSANGPTNPAAFKMRLGREVAPPGLSGKGAPALPGYRTLSLSRALGYAQSAIDSGDGARALEILEAQIPLHPVDPHLLLHLARARAAAGDVDGAIDTFYRAKEHSANNPIVDLFLGQSLLLHDRAAEAEEALRRCLQTEEKNTLAANLLALCLFRQGRFREAFEEWNRAGWSNSVSFLIEMTIIFERFLLEAPEAEPPQLPFLDPSGESAAENSPEPGGFFSEALRRRRVKGLLNKAERRLAAQRTDDAWELTGRALELSPGDPDALLLRAVALYEQGLFQEAGRMLLQVLRKDGSIFPRCFLAYSLLRMGAVEIAEEMLGKISPEGPWDYYLHYHLALCEIIRGDLGAARRFLGVAYREYFPDTYEYCFEYLIQKVQEAVQRIDGGAKDEAEPDES